MAVVGCAGILVSDTFCGPMAHLPGAGELLVVPGMTASPGGCAANVAIDLAKQVFEVDVAGCVGQDAAAEALIRGLQESGVNTARVARTSAHATSRTVILLVEGDDRRYIHDFGANRAFSVAHIDRDWLRGLEVFYLGGLFGMPAVSIGALVDLLGYCREEEVTTVVDVLAPEALDARADLARLLPQVDYFLPNDDEAARMTGKSKPREQMRALLALGARNVIVTCGRDGSVAGDGKREWTCGAFALPSVDPSGSGDAFAAGIVTGILRRWDMPQTLKYAAALGASATTAIGTTAGVLDAAAASSYVASHALELRDEAGSR